MENLLIILVISLLVAVIILIAVLSYFGNRFLKLKEKNLKEKSDQPEDNLEKTISLLREKQPIDPEVLKSLRSSQKIKQKKIESSVFCKDHPDEYSNGKCSISGDSYCEICLTKQDDIKIARKYLDLYLDHKWQELFMVPSGKENKDLMERIYNVKMDLWKTQSLPVIVQGHFKINIHDDQIEEYIVVLAREEDQALVREKLSFIK